MIPPSGEGSHQTEFHIAKTVETNPVDTASQTDGVATVLPKQFVLTVIVSNVLSRPEERLIQKTEGFPMK